MCENNFTDNQDFLREQTFDDASISKNYVQSNMVKEITNLTRHLLNVDDNQL
jgi:hypothetical protein